MARELIFASIAAAGLGWAAAADGSTASVTLAWDPSTDPHVVAYNVYYGAASQTYTNNVPLAAVTNVTITGLVPGVTYFFAATASESAGPESGFSNEVLYYVRPVLTVTADSASRPYGQTNPPFTATYSGFVNGETVSVLTGTLLGTSAAQTNSPVGLYPIHVSGQSAANYTIQYLDGTLSVTSAPLLVQALNSSRAYGQTNPPFAATLTGFVNGENQGVLSGTLAFATPAQTNSPLGQYPIIPTGLTATNYSLSFSNGTLTVSACALVASADNQSRIYGAANPVLTGRLAGVQSGDNITASYSTAATAASPVGSYPITVTLSDPNQRLANYSVSTNNGTLSIGPATLWGLAMDQSRAYGQTNPPFTVIYGGFVNGDTESMLTGTLFGSSPAQTNSPVGLYPIHVSGQSAANYTIRYLDGTLSVTPAPLLVQALNSSRPYGQTNPPFAATLTGFVNGENQGVLSGTLAFATPAQTNSPLGQYPIIPSGLTATNYALSFSNGTLTITPAGGAGGTNAVNILLANSGRQADGNFKLAALAVSGGTYLVEGTTDLKNWTVLSTNVADASGLIHYVDLQATNYSRRFYRVTGQ